VLAGNPANAAWVESLAVAMTATHDLFVCENLTLADTSVRHVERMPMNLASRTVLLFIKKEESL